MNHDDHIHLLRKGLPASRSPGAIWADLGSGEGAFTLALADLLGAGARIYSVDRDRRALIRQEQAMRAHFPAVDVSYIAADFTRPLDLSSLDGIVMANSLHFVRLKEPVLRLVLSYLRPGGRLLLVEYNADRGNPWVPYPFSYSTWEDLARQAGFASTRLLERRPSRFLGEIYSALSLVPA
ncbi:MAG: class I SAM-dependent methyltransferase [Ktedonobacteraceae bacterium]|nr:class I SAM-dependent methyltransferase [Ktedonobacteraceae bacterium]